MQKKTSEQKEKMSNDKCNQNDDDKKKADGCWCCFRFLGEKEKNN